MKLKSKNVFKTNQIFDLQIVFYSAEKGSFSITWFTGAVERIKFYENNLIPFCVQLIRSLSYVISIPHMLWISVLIYNFVCNTKYRAVYTLVSWFKVPQPTFQVYFSNAIAKDKGVIYMCGDDDGETSQVVSFDGQKFVVKGNLRKSPYDATAFMMKGA